MPFFLSLLIVAALPTAASEARFPDAVPVYQCVFSGADKDYDGWPDDWVRYRAPGYPLYVKMNIAEAESPVAKSCLQFDLNGGPARIDSPPIPVGTLFSYVLEGYVKTEGLAGDEASISVSIFNAKKKLLETHVSPVARATQDWTKLRIGPISPGYDDASYAIIGLQTRPTARQADLKGHVWFDDIWFAQVPRMTLTTNRRHNLYFDSEKPEITCRVSGFLDHEPVLNFELLDAFGAIVARSERRLTRENSTAMGGAVIPMGVSPVIPMGVSPVIPMGSSPVIPMGSSAVKFARAGKSDGNGQVENLSHAAQPIAGSTTWSPPIDDVGFYRVRVTMPSSTAVVHQRELALAVVHPQTRVPTSEFGWTAPRGEQALPLADFAEIAGQAGIGKLKFPLWTSPQDIGRIDQLAAFAERLGSDGVELIGLLTNPPADVKAAMGDADLLTAAGVFSTDPQIWYPSIEPAVTRLSLKVRWWQLGLDNDTSFVGYPKLPEKIEQIKHRLSRFGQQVNLGIGWRWVSPQFADEHPPWSFLSLTSDPSLTDEELGDYLQATAPSSHAQRWVVVEPLAKSKYTLEDRTADLVHRMLAAKIHKADAVFVPDVCDNERGLLGSDGAAAELFLPWRTTALALAGGEYLGSIELPGGSANRIFVHDGNVTMAVWSDQPRREVIYLGEDVRQVDVWGRAKKPAQEGDKQVIEVGRMPSFVTGLSEPIARMQLSFAFAQTQLPSVFGRPHTNSYSLKNAFPQGIGGHIRLVTPDVWRTVPREMNVKLSAGETLNQPFEITLPYDASSGRQKVRIDCELNADRRYAFSIYRHIDIGVDDVTIELNTHLRDDHDLEVEQRLFNHTDQLVSFKCQLFAPDRRRMISQVLDQGRGSDKKIYRIANGEDLVGKTLWLRAEEIGGQRILNYRVTVEK